VVIQWHPYLSEWLSVSQHGNIYLWGNVPKMKWSAFAAEFEEIDENVEYIEKETEFDQVSGIALIRLSVSLTFIRKIKRKLRGEREQQRRRMSTLEQWKMLSDLKEVVASC
jgi:hypothetical protein